MPEPAHSELVIGIPIPSLIQVVTHPNLRH